MNKILPDLQITIRIPTPTRPPPIKTTSTPPIKAIFFHTITEVQTTTYKRHLQTITLITTTCHPPLIVYLPIKAVGKAVSIIWIECILGPVKWCIRVDCTAISLGLIQIGGSRPGKSVLEAISVCIMAARLVRRMEVIFVLEWILLAGGDEIPRFPVIQAKNFGKSDDQNPCFHDLSKQTFRSSRKTTESSNVRTWQPIFTYHQSIPFTQPQRNATLHDVTLQ